MSRAYAQVSDLVLDLLSIHYISIHMAMLTFNMYLD
jgi:hypothetical protein